MVAVPPTHQHRLLLGLAIRREREARALSQEALAERSHLHRTYIGSVERGERNISIDSIHRIAQALGIPAGDLVSSIDAAPSGTAEHDDG